MSPRPVIAAMIAVQLLSAQEPEPAALLERAREKLVGVAKGLPRYTCIETINRTYYVQPQQNAGKQAMTAKPAGSCKGLEFGHNGPLSLDAKDRLRLQVAIAGEREIHSWATASRFDNRTVFQMVGVGPISSGTFGTYLIDIFENPGAVFKFKGRKLEVQREVFEYSFRVPLDASHSIVNGGTGWKATGYSGSFEINAATAELARLTQETDELPSGAKMCRARTAIDYHYVLIGDGQFLVPSETVLETLSPNAEETSSTTTFSGCHEYTAESSIRFDDQTDSNGSAGQTLRTVAALPPGISLTLAFIEPLNFAAAAGGDEVAAKVVRTVRAGDAGKILVPAGAVARGRILQARHQYASSAFQISIAFETLEMQGTIAPLSVRLERELKLEKSRNQHGLKSQATEFGLPLASGGETGSWFAFPARGPTHVIPAGFESKWITVAAGGLDGLLPGDRTGPKFR